MTSPSRPLAHRLPAWLGPCASFVCLIHCFGTGFIALFAPGLLKLLPHTEVFEWAVLALAALSGGSVLLKQKASRPWRTVYVVAFVAAVTGLLAEAHRISHLAIFVLGTSPAILLLLKHRNSRIEPACCAEEHAHEAAAAARSDAV